MILKKATHKKIICLYLLALVLLLSSFTLTVSAKKSLPIAGSDKYGHLSNPAPDGEAEIRFDRLTAILYQDLLYIIGGVAVFFLIFSGFRLVTAGGEEEVINKQKTNLYWTVIGLILISIATQVDKIFFLGSDGDYEGTFLNSTEHSLASSGIFNETVFIIISFIKIIIASVAIFFIVRSGANLVVGGFNEETLNKEKKNIGIGILSLIGITLASTVVNKIFLNIEENFQPYGTAEATVNLGPGIEELIGLINFLVTFVSPIAILALIGASIYYLISLGDEEKMGKAKNIIINAIIGILIIYGAFGLVTTFVAGSIEGEQQEDQ